MGRNIFDGWHIVILVLLVVILFGWKRLPDAARSLGRSARILKAEADEFKAESRARSEAAGQTAGSQADQPTRQDEPPRHGDGTDTDVRVA